MKRKTIFLGLLLTACTGESGEAGTTTSGTDAGTEAGTATDTASDSTPTTTSVGTSANTSNTTTGPTTGATTAPTTGPTGGTTTGATATAGTTSDTGQPQEGEVHFIAMGDAGEGNMGQYAVANAIEVLCGTKPCDFVLYLGDNFYDTGVDSNMDQQFTDKFEMPYMDLDPNLRFYIVLGNHDYGEISNEWQKSQYEIEYTQFSERWYMPSEWYSFQAEHVEFFALDTTRFMWDHETAQQQGWMDQEIGASTAAWKIAFGHHPYISNGAHGNAGNFEGFPFPDFVAGGTVKSVFDESICGKVNVYFDGHDHNRQLFEEVCGTHFVVSGAGAKTKGFSYHDTNPTIWEDATKEGFMYVSIVDDVMTIEVYDFNGTVEYTHQIMK